MNNYANAANTAYTATMREKCNHNKIIRIITPTPRHQCFHCGEEFILQQKADEMRYFAAWMGFCAGVVLMGLVGIVWLAVVG